MLKVFLFNLFKLFRLHNEVGTVSKLQYFTLSSRRLSSEIILLSILKRLLMWVTGNKGKSVPTPFFLFVANLKRKEVYWVSVKRSKIMRGDESI